MLKPSADLSVSIEETFHAQCPENKEPWKAWHQGTRKNWGFEGFREIANLRKVGKSSAGAISGICSVIAEWVSTDSDEEELNWAVEWLDALETNYAENATDLLAAAPEICLANAQLGRGEAVKHWLVRLTDPSDNTTLDPVYAELAHWLMLSGQLAEAEIRISQISSPSLRDPLLAIMIRRPHRGKHRSTGRLATRVIAGMDSDTSRAAR